MYSPSVIFIISLILLWFFRNDVDDLFLFQCTVQFIQTIIL